MNLQQYQKETLKKFEEVLKDSLHYDMDDETGDPLIRGSYWDIREPLKSFLQEALKGQLEVVVKMAEEMKRCYQHEDNKFWNTESDGHNSALSLITTPLLAEINLK